jgi:hypothetical protein
LFVVAFFIECPYSLLAFDNIISLSEGMRHESCVYEAFL